MLLTPTAHEIVHHVANLVYSRIQAPDLCVAIFYVPTMPVIEVPQIAHDLTNLVDGRQLSGAIVLHAILQTESDGNSNGLTRSKVKMSSKGICRTV